MSEDSVHATDVVRRRHRASTGDRPLRILHLGKYFPPHRGGMETFLRDLMAEQQRQGLEVRALVHATRRSLRSHREVREEQSQRLKLTRVARWFTAAFAPISPTFPLVLARDLREMRPDILHIHMPNLSAFWCLILPAARRIPWVVHWHADVLASTHSRALRLLYRFYRPFEQALLSRAARIIATSPPYLESSEPLAQHRRRCCVVPLGIIDHPAPDPVTTAGAAGARGSGKEQLRVLFVGRLTYYKGLAYLIQAAASLKEVTLIIIGTGEEKRQLETLVDTLGIKDRVSFGGALSDEDVQRSLDACDCLCLPSIERTEAFGVVLLEAMRAARPCVATRVPGTGMGWVIEDGESGLLAQPEDTLALQTALSHLRDHPEDRSRMGVAARRRFSENFAITPVALLMAGIYRRA